MPAGPPPVSDPVGRPGTPGIENTAAAGQGTTADRCGKTGEENQHGRRV